MLLTPYLTQEELQKLLMSIWSWMRFVTTIVHNFYCIPGYLILNWFILLPLYYTYPHKYTRFENYLYNWLLYIVGSWSYGANIEIHEFGDNIYQLNDDNVKILIISNHQSTGDVPLMMQSLASRSKYVLLWIMDVVFKYTNFGIVSIVHGDYFLNTKNYKKEHIIEHLRKFYNKNKNAIILFPEGGFRHKRIQSSNKYATAQKLPVLNYVTYPRFGAYNDVMSEKVGITHVIDLTIMYEDLHNPLSIIDIARGHRKSRVIFHYKLFDCSLTNCNEQWLTDRWHQKELMLQQYYTDKTLLLESLKCLNVVAINYVKVIAIHFFYLFICYATFIAYKRVSYCLSNVIY